MLGRKEKLYVEALDDIGFDVKKGEILGILGPNGAGKTTLLKVVAGFLLPENGNVSVNGFDIVEERNSVRTSCSFLRAEGWIIFDYKYPIYKNLEYWAVFMGLGLGEARKRIDPVLKDVGLYEKRTDYPENLSAGMRQKLNLARCLLAPRPIFLLDEPTANIDPYSANFLRKFFKERLRALRTTTLLATHNLWEAEMICDRVAILHKGKLLMIGSTSELKDKLGEEMAFIGLGACSKDVRKEVESLEFITGVKRTDKGLQVYGRGLKVNILEVLDICREHCVVKSLEIKEPSLNEVFIQLIETEMSGRESSGKAG